VRSNRENCPLSRPLSAISPGLAEWATIFWWDLPTTSSWSSRRGLAWPQGIGLNEQISGVNEQISGRGQSDCRDFAAWLGLVPKQISTGDRTILGKISKRGNRYLRVLFFQAAWVVLIKPKSWDRHGLKPWLEAAKKRLHHNVLAIALANKIARIAWSVLAHGRTFEASKIQVA